MDTLRLKFHLKIILDGIFFLFRISIGSFYSTLFVILLIKLTAVRIWKSGIKWNLNSPLINYLQSFAVFIYVFDLFFLFPIIGFGFNLLMYYLNNYGRAALVFYMLYIYHNHSTTFSISDQVGSEKWRNNFLGRLARSYFPVELVKTVDLEPNRNYLIACFPHGMMGFGFTINMYFDISKWHSLFPRTRPMIATLDLHFLVPLRRYSVRKFGAISVSKDALLHYLSQSNDINQYVNKDGFTSNAVGLVVGGARESEDSSPGIYKLTLKNRKGFIKMAILSGSSIVPSFSFGEVDLYDQVFSEPGSFDYWFQCFIRRMYGIWPSFAIGCGFLQKSFGCLPQKRRLVQVVGAPIDVVQCDKPDRKYVDEIHEKFIEAIVTLFETHKKYYLSDYENVQLIIT